MIKDLAALRILTREGEGLSLWGPGGDRYRFLVTGAETGNSSFVLEALVPPGGGPPPHIHLKEDEFFYLLEGSLSVHVGGKTIEATAGDFIHAPRGVSHHYRNNGAVPARMLAMFTPAGMEHWFTECLVPVSDQQPDPPEVTAEFIARMVEAGPRHGVAWG